MRSGTTVDIEQTVVDLDVERAVQERARWAEYLRAYGGMPFDRMLAVSQMQKTDQVLARLRDVPPNRSEIVSLTTKEGWPMLDDVDREAVAQRHRQGRALARYTLHRWREPVTAR